MAASRRRPQTLLGKKGCCGVPSGVVCKNERAVRIGAGDGGRGRKRAAGFGQQRLPVGGSAGDRLKVPET